MKEVEVVAVGRRVGGEVQRRAPGEVPIVGGRRGQGGEQGTLELGQRHNLAPVRQASRLPCFMSCSATHGTSAAPISRSGRYDQKQVARKRRNARRASRTFTMARAVSGSSVRRLLRPPRDPISAR